MYPWWEIPPFPTIFRRVSLWGTTEEHGYLLVAIAGTDQRVDALFRRRPSAIPSFLEPRVFCKSPQRLRDSGLSVPHICGSQLIDALALNPHERSRIEAA
jgi:hypothetical protein